MSLDFKDWQFCRISQTGAGQRLICPGPGQLGVVVINKRVNSAVLRLTDGFRDEATGSGAGVIAEITQGTTSDAPTYILFGCEFSRGLVMEMTGTAVDYTITYKRKALDQTK